MFGSSHAFNRAQIEIDQCKESGAVSLDLSNMSLTAEGLERLIEDNKGFFSQIQSLDLQDNDLLYLPENIASLFQLENLELDHNGLMNLPESIGDLGNLRYLRADNNKLERLPESIGNLKMLIGLSVNSNQLQSLPTTIGNLDSLETLFIRSNKLNTLPKCIVSLPSVTYLNVVNNNIHTIADAFHEGSKLSIINLSKNALEELPESIGRLKCLQTLDISENKLQSVPESVGAISNLEYLYVLHNNLQQLPSTISNISSLQILALQHNQLSSIPESVTSLPNCNGIHLQNNPLDNDTMHYLECSGFNNIEYNMAAYEFNHEENDWLEVLKELDCQSDFIKEIISSNENLQKFLTKATQTALYRNGHKDIVFNGLSYLLSHLKDDYDLVMAEIIGSLGDCSTPVADLLSKKHFLRMQETGQALDPSLLEKLALMDYIQKHEKMLSLSRGDAIECAHGLVNAVYLDGSECIQSNKIKINNRKYTLPSGTNYIDFAFNQVSSECAYKFAQVICITDKEGKALQDENGCYTLDEDKLALITHNYCRYALPENADYNKVLEEGYSRLYEILAKYDYDCINDPQGFFPYKEAGMDEIKHYTALKSGMSPGCDYDTNQLKLSEYLQKIELMLQPSSTFNAIFQSSSESDKEYDNTALDPF